MLNNPSKYVFSNIQMDNINYLQNSTLKIEDVLIREYECSAVSDALELLCYNKHIYDNFIDEFLDINSRRISLTQQGAFAYRDGYYLNEAQKNIGI